MEQTVSFSKKLKIELSEVPYACGGCKAAEVYGLLLFGRSLGGKTVSFATEHKAVADRFVSGLIDLTSAIVTVKYIGSRYHKGGKLYIAEVEDELDSELINSRFADDSGNGGLLENSEIIKNDCCKSAFLRGAFMACGSIIDPEKEYHLEFVVQNSRLAQCFMNFIGDLGIPIKSTVRKNATVLYIKESENIEDILTLMGAVRSSLEIMNVKIVKDVRNKVNRVTNCETANIGKTVAASTKQIEDIKYIKRKKGLGFLADDLRETAQLRLENPDMSLKELSGLLSGSISRSGVNHRLKRISETAEELRKAENKR